MLKKYRFLRWFLYSLISLILLVVAFGFWFFNQLSKPEPHVNLETTVPKDLPYLTQNKPQLRGKILAVVTSQQVMGSSEKKTGYELTELSRPYYVFMANGFEVDIASPKGGKPPVVIDKDDMGNFDYAFLNDANAQSKIANTLIVDQVDMHAYAGVYFVGGKGAMFDFPENPAIQNIIESAYKEGKTIGAVCHGPAALLRAKKEDGSLIIKGKKLCGFSNAEELLLIPEAKSIFPFLLEDELKRGGVSFKEGPIYLNQVVRDGNIVTGQNPWSTWSLAETMIENLGYIPVHRTITAEEHSVSILGVYHKKGIEDAKGLMEEYYAAELPVDRNLIAIHSLVAAMQLNLGDFYQKLRLLSYAKSLAGE